jgi:sterol desaturase/sphingolipid hydroxylase (fatty acid hydroxylase superfamily)
MTANYIAYAHSMAWTVLWVGAFFFVIETIWPADTSTRNISSRIRGFGYWLVYIAIVATALSLFSQHREQLGISPLFSFKAGSLLDGTQGFVSTLYLSIAALASLFISDFFYYWFHRAQHSFALLWRFHRVHHSIRDMNALNSTHHFSEEILRIPFVTIPFALLIDFDPGPTPWIAAAIFSMQGQFVHSNTQFNFGILRYVFVDNRFHRLHHSVEEQHFDKNFGAITTLYDTVFGTAQFPAKGEWPATGITELSEPKRLGDYLWSPFRRESHSTPPPDDDNEVLKRSLPKYLETFVYVALFIVFLVLPFWSYFNLG